MFPHLKLTTPIRNNKPAAAHKHNGGYVLEIHTTFQTNQRKAPTKQSLIQDIVGMEPDFLRSEGYENPAELVAYIIFML